MSTLPATEAVQKIIQQARTTSERPTDAQLGPCYSFLIPPDRSSDHPTSSSPVSASDDSEHWYCSRAKSDTHRDVAGYLLFLFAFKRQGTSKIWVDTLEKVLKSCEECSRGFGIARREFGALYMSHYPLVNRVNFFRTVDNWQSSFVLSEAAALGDIGYASTSNSTTNAISSLSIPITQLLLAEPSLLEIEGVSSFIDSSISSSPPSPLSNIASIGLTPLVVRLLRSPILERRKWAFIQMQASARKKLSFDMLIRTGVKEEVEELCHDSSLENKEKWKMVKTMLKKECFEAEAVEKGFLGGIDIGGKVRKNKLMMAALAPLLGTESDYFSTLLEVLALLLHIAPTRLFWTFDTSPELPHALFSDIKSNPSFLSLCENNSRLPTTSSFSDHVGHPDKGKAKAGEEMNPFGWLTDFLTSLVSDHDLTQGRTVDTGFGEALARTMGDCFQELQHARYSVQIRTAAAQAGFKSMSSLLERPNRLSDSQSVASSSALSIHCKFITGVALRPQDFPAPDWKSARDAALYMLSIAFRMDGRDILESTLWLSVIAYEEKKRQVRAKKAEQKGVPAPPPVPVSKIHIVSVRKDLWAASYNALSPKDSAGMAIVIKAIASFAHIEKLNREETWSYADLKLQAVIKEDDFVAAIRGINNGIVACRDSFSHALESLAMQSDQSLSRNLWEQPDAPRDVIKLLLSPAEDVHDPTISLVQQSFDNVDDRADCFRILLTRFPAQSMDGLCDFLASFIETARVTPESCSLAKWLVRCFTDVLEALCVASDDGSEPLLRSNAFTSVFADGEPMRKRVLQLWHLMTTSLAVILKRTIDWAPLYDNETMVDWMRDALIFGRQMAENIRSFEAATLSASGAQSRSGDVGESPVRQTQTGAKLVQKLENVLRDLVSWLRLTDLETLHQTFELIKTIVERIAKTNPDVSKQPELELTLYELDKFSRKASRSYKTRLSDDLLSEISEMLEPFNLDTGEEIQFIKSTPAQVVPPPAVQLGSSPVQSTSSSKPPIKPKNAFEEMMRRAGGPATSTTGKVPTTLSTSVKPKPASVDVVEIDDDDEFDDGFLDNFSAAELDKLESKSAHGTSTKTINADVRRTASGQPSLKFPLRPVPSATKSDKLNIDLVRRPSPKPSGFKSNFMRELQREHRADRAAQFQRDRIIGGVVPKLPPASGLGTGLGVYQGPRRTVQPVDSGSSASESSDDENRPAPKAEAKKIVKITQPVVERRPIKVLGNDMSDMIRQRDERRARQHAQKMRLKPDLNGLYRFVLSWNPDHTGQTPPHHPSLAKDLGQMGMVPTTFLDADRYRRVMLPLFLQELWMQCLKDDVRSPPLVIEISSRAYEDDFLDMELTVQGQLPEGWYANESDIILLKTPVRGFLAKVQGFKKKFKDTAIKVRILSLVDDPKLLAVKSKVQLQKHVSLSTALREYGALQGLPYYDAPLLRDILNARSARMSSLSSNDVRDAMENFTVNEPQARAILGAMSTEGFALIQGPPGTGKTKTISGLVGKFLSDRGSFIASANGDKPSKKKLLVCAPSNAAIDEVCKRLMHGVPSAYGGQHSPNIVRIGIESSVNIAVKPVALESLVEARVTSTGGGRDGGGDYTRIQAELEEVKKNIMIKQEELRAAQGNDERVKQIEGMIFSLTQKRTSLGQQSSKAKDAARDATRHLEGARRSARESIMNEADIICATLSGAGHDSLAPYTFETVIIDEAAQAIEMSCLIPLKYGCKRCIMVGDPNQLPPTTFSSDAEKLHYNESLFVRMVKQDASNVRLLSIQYRMHPFISELPSKVFYNGQLKDGEAMAEKTRAVWHEKAVYGPYRFFNVQGAEQKQGTSTKNIREAQVAVELVQRLQADFGSKVNFDTRIGIISMYKEQLGELKRQFIGAFGRDILDRIEFNTVDGFQGQEKDIIILSCVRSGPNLQTIGFLRDPRRMNVALTRAKSSLFVIGNGPTLERSDERWRTIVGDARERGFFADYDASLFNKRLMTAPEITKKKVKDKPKESIQNSGPSPVKPSLAKATGPPLSIMDEAQPLKRKASAEVKVEREEKKRKSDVHDIEMGSEIEERKKKKKDKKRKKELEEGSTRDSTPPSTTSESTVQRSKPIDNKPDMSSVPALASAQPVQSVAGSSRPIPPGPGFQHMQGPKQITKPSAGSSALFHQKKKKKPPPPTGPKPPGPPIKQVINSNLRR